MAPEEAGECLAGSVKGWGEVSQNITVHRDGVGRHRSVGKEDASPRIV